MDAEHASLPEPPKKKRKTSTKATRLESHPVDVPTKEQIFDLVEPEFTEAQSSSRIDPDIDMRDAYGEASSLQHADAVDKRARKKSLRFHTSKIESASARRQGARNQAVGGDDDLPYRERRKEKEARLAKEAAAKVRGQGGADLDDTEPEPKAGRTAKEGESSDDEANGPDGYYELVKKKSKERKEQKKAEYEAAQAARYVLICPLQWYFIFRNKQVRR
jgi:U3 small nucleolar RNA-associated protein 3